MILGHLPWVEHVVVLERTLPTFRWGKTTKANPEQGSHIGDSEAALSWLPVVFALNRPRAVRPASGSIASRSPAPASDPA